MTITVLIASPVEAELVERIQKAMPTQVRVIYEPDLLPIPRYPSDHGGRRRDLAPKVIDRWRGLLGMADVLFDFDWLDPASMPTSAPRLRWVQATSSGIGEFVDRLGLRGSGITFTTAGGVHAGPLAEFVALGLLYFTKQVSDLQRWQADRRWQRYATREVRGQRVVLIGGGHVGREIARTLGQLRVEVILLTKTPRPDLFEGVAREITRIELVETLPDCDAVVLACPYTPETHHLIAARELAALPSRAVLINVSRGAVVDEPALIDALASGRLAGAWLDVFGREPLPPESPLWGMPNVLVSPHSASTVGAENERIVELFIDNLYRYLDGQPLLNLYQPERGY